MMKRIVLCLLILVSSFIHTERPNMQAVENPHAYPTGVGTGQADPLQTMIPDQAIRLRIIAHSDDRLDQEIKYAIRDQVSASIHDQVQTIEDLAEARQAIHQAIPSIEEIVSGTLAAYGQAYPFQVTFQEKIAFPEKIYGSYRYPAGDYEAILITLGHGLGENWWCVLFPPLCFIDFFGDASLAEADEEATDLEETEGAEVADEEEVEVRFFLLDLFNLL